MREKMIKKLCKFIHWYNENGEESYYNFYTGYLAAMRDIGMEVEIFRNEIVWVDGKTYKVEDYK